MQLIKFTVYKRNENIINAEQAFDVDDIISPIRFNSATGKSYFTLKAKTLPSPKMAVTLPVNYQVSHTLSAIEALDNKFIRVTVLKRNNRSLVVNGVTLTSEQMVFVTSKISEALITTSLGTRFFYLEQGDNEPVQYEVSESIDAIIAQTNSGPGTGTVTSVSIGGLAPIFTASVSNPTITPALSFAQINKSPNLFFSGPASGSPSAPDFRAITADDITAALGTQNVEFFSNQTVSFLDLANEARSDRHFIVSISSGSGGTVILIEGPEYTRSLAGSVTRVNFTSPLVSQDALIYYSY